MSSVATELLAQTTPELSNLPPLPSTGWAGMYAGTSSNALFCMGGTNFLDKKPWEGGKRNISKEIYMLAGEASQWVKLNDELDYSMAYGVSASYKNKFFLVGGITEAGKILSQVYTLEWDGEKLNKEFYPELPFPLAYMCGSIVNDFLIVAGGMDAMSILSKQCFALDLLNLDKGWTVLPDIPGRERMLAVCTSFNTNFYLFSGETKTSNSYGEYYRDILQDAYSLSILRDNNHTSLRWIKLATMPKGMSAGASPAPALNNSAILLWGGVDAVTALHEIPATHPGISNEVFNYLPGTDKWEFAGKLTTEDARVTLPVVYWKNQWVYLSGEVRPGVRDNAVITIGDK